MKIYFKLELKKALLSWKSAISILIILVTFAIPYLDEVHFQVYDLDGIEYFLTIMSKSLNFIVAPIITGIIYSTSIIKDKDTGFIDKLLELIDIKTYFKVKLTVNALVSFSVLILGYGLVILYFIIVYGVKNSFFLGVPPGAFLLFGNFSKLSNIIFIFLIIPIVSVAFSTFIFGITTVTDKKFIGYILPIFYSILIEILSEMWQMNSVIDFNIGRLFNEGLYSNAKLFNIIIYNSMLALVGIFLLYRFGYKRILALYEKKV